ncbi:MAG: hypothetical protein RLZZ228_685 [Actinomycetota bacterium]
MHDLTDRRGPARAQGVDTLTESEWRSRAAAHRARVDPWIAPRLARRTRGESHPVDDFLFDYYSWRPGQLARWHPGMGVTLTGNVGDFVGMRGYVVDETGARVDVSALPLDVMKQALAIVEATASRTPSFTCFGRHEWAMVYRLDSAKIRHTAWPLRLDQGAIDAVVESSPLRCTHFDAFRFYTEPARPLNLTVLTRTGQIQTEQPGCLHATMDLYKWCFRSYPAIGADLTADCFDLAREVRTIDMRASPYDFSDLGLMPIRIETPHGRGEYVEHQRDFAERGALLRRTLMEALTRALDGTGSP